MTITPNFSLASGEELYAALEEMGPKGSGPHAENDCLLVTTDFITNGFASCAVMVEAEKKAYPILLTREQLILLKDDIDYMIITLDGANT